MLTELFLSKCCCRVKVIFAHKDRVVFQHLMEL